MNAVSSHDTSKLRAARIHPDRNMSYCPKCVGSGKFITYSPYDGRTTFVGKCFECNGAGELSSSKVENSEASRMRVSLALHTVETCIMLAVRDGNESRAEFYLQRVVREYMFCVGRAGALRILDAIGSGAWRDDNTMSPRWGERGAVDPELAQQWRARAIEIGRELRAAACA